MVEKKVQKTKVQSDYLSDSDTLDEEVTLLSDILHIYIYYCTFVTLFLLNVFPFTMNTSSWKKAVDLVGNATPANLQVQVAATTPSQQLESLPLSELSIDDSGAPQVTYDSQQPMATSTPRATSTVTSETPTEAYHQILPGMSDHLYPTLIADSSLTMHVPDNHGTLQTQLTSEVDKYLQEAAERHERDINYFDGRHNTTS